VSGYVRTKSNTLCIIVQAVVRTRTQACACIHFMSSTYGGTARPSEMRNSSSETGGSSFSFRFRLCRCHSLLYCTHNTHQPSQGLTNHHMRLPEVLSVLDGVRERSATRGTPLHRAAAAANIATPTTRRGRGRLVPHLRARTIHRTGHCTTATTPPLQGLLPRTHLLGLAVQPGLQFGRALLPLGQRLPLQALPALALFVVTPRRTSAGADTAVHTAGGVRLRQLGATLPLKICTIRALAVVF
jgi:hypothetical protein